MLWQINSFPKCRYHTFLSHCQEDRAGLVLPVYQRLQTLGIRSFIDVEDYYYGRDSRSALRNGLLDSRHTIFFITDAMLSNSRGWCVLELAFAEVIELNFAIRGGQLLNQFLPLFLVDQSDPRLPRSVWQLVRDRGQFSDIGGRIDPVEWCSRKILDFLHREQDFSNKVSNLAINDELLKVDLDRTAGLSQRVTRFQPIRLRRPNTAP